MNMLTCPLPLYERILMAIVQNPQQAVFVNVGKRQTLFDQEWLARDLIANPYDSRNINRAPAFQIVRIPDPSAIFLLPPVLARLNVVGHLYIHVEPARHEGESPKVNLWGTLHNGSVFEPLQMLSLVGAGLHHIPVLDPNSREPFSKIHKSPIYLPKDRWSRTIGALGGIEIWQRFVRLHIGIIGCGRTGSLIAHMLAKLGIVQITLIDADILEMHNLGEMDCVTEADLGRPKVEAVADNLRLLLPDIQIQTVIASISHPTAMAAAKQCDVLFSCADNDAARLVTAILATLYHKVHIDIGTGIFFPSGNEQGNKVQEHKQTGTNLSIASQTKDRIMGIDVRLILPHDGCLLCRGNLTQYARAIDDICNHRAPTEIQGDWQQQRAGSLLSLNTQAAARAIDFLQSLVAERIQSSTWEHVEIDNFEHANVTYPLTNHTNTSPTCALCAKAGLGDEGLRM